MAKIVTEDIGGFNHHYPKVAAVITASAGGKDSAMAAAWHSSISLKPPLYGISLFPGRFTYELMAESGEFGINFLPFEKASLVAAAGGFSGRDCDKFQRLSLIKEKPLKTGVPVLREAYAAYECRIEDTRAYGDHLWIVGRIVAVHFVEEMLAEKKNFDPAHVRPLLYLGLDYYASADASSYQHVRRGTG